MSRLGAFRSSTQPAASTTSPAAEVETQQTETVVAEQAVAETPVAEQAAAAPATATRRLGGAGVKSPAVGSRLGGAKTTTKPTTSEAADTVDTTEDASTSGRKPLVMLGSAKRRQPAEERVIQQGDRMPINMVHDAFHEFMLNSDEIDASSMSKKDTTAVFKLVETFMQDLVKKHPVQFMGLLFRHKPVAERFYAPRISEFVTYVGDHVQIEAKTSVSEPLKAFLMTTAEGMKAFTEELQTVVEDGVEKQVAVKVQNDDLDYLVGKFQAQSQQ